MALSTENAKKRRARNIFTLSAMAWAVTLSLLAWTGWNSKPAADAMPSQFDRGPVVQAAYSVSPTSTPKPDILLAQQATTPTTQAVTTQPGIVQETAQTETAQADFQGQAAPTQPVRLPAATNSPQPSLANNVHPQATFRLEYLTADRLHARLQKILTKPLHAHPDVTGQWHTFNVGAVGDPPVAISVHTTTGEIQLAGAANQVRAWRRIIQILDTPPDTSNQPAGSSPPIVTQLVATGGKSSAKIRQAVDVLQNQGSGRQSQPGSSRETADSNPAAGNQNGLQPQKAVPQAMSAEHSQQIENPLNSLLGPVQIEFIEGTGILMLRGNPRDVAQVLEIVNEIERLSRISEPRIEVHELAHVSSEALSRMLQELFNIESLYSVYGQPIVLPLVQPNAILIIGQPVSVEKAVEILEKLDLPGKSLTQYEVFRLQHATATDIRTVIENLFTGTQEEGVPTLQAKALVVADLRTNTLIVRAGPRDMAEVRALVSELDQSGSETVSEVRVFKLRNSVATDLAPVLNSALQGSTSATPGGGSESAGLLAPLLRLITIDPAGKQQLESGILAGTRVTADPRANALVVAAPPGSMPLLEALINQLDQPPGATAELKVFTIANGDAVSLAEMLQSLFGDPAQQGGGSNENEALFQLRISVDERTNSIIVAGTGADLLVVEAVLLRLDSSDVRQRQNRVYRLKNASAEGVSEALSEWLQAERDVQETAPGVTSPFSQVEREVVVVPDLNSNSLIISSTPRYYDEVIRVVEQLDEQAPMVMIQVLIGEVRLGDADEFGVELGLQDSALFDRSLLEGIETTTSTVTTPSSGGANTLTQQIIQSATLTPGFDFTNPSGGLGNSGSDRSLATAGVAAAQGISNFAVRRISPDLGFSGMVLSASSNSVSMLLRALQETRRLEVLSRPQIMALDNQEGRVFVGEQVPYITSSNIEQTGFRSNNIELIEVGLVLQVTPRISPDGLVVMSVFANKSELGTVADGVPVSIAPNGDAINAPRIATTQAETTVSAVSGQTVVLSGLLTKRNEALHRRVPLLADIPLLGDLFRFDSTRIVRKELLIILTPHIVRNRFDAERIKQIESARMSWCLADVVDLHGPAGLKSRSDLLGEAEAETVYPNYVPEAEEIQTPHTVQNADQSQPVPEPFQRPVRVPPGELRQPTVDAYR
jgi:type II secretion system protein D